MSQKFTTDDIVTTLNVNIRTAQRYVESLIIKDKNKISFEKDVFDLIISRHTNDNLTTDENEVITDYFTPEEYEEFKKRLIVLDRYNSIFFSIKFLNLMSFILVLSKM